MGIDKYRPEGTRNFIRLGDRVKFQMMPGRAIHEAKVRAIHSFDGVTVDSVEIVICRTKTNGKVDSKGGSMRVVSPEKISRMSQAKVKRAID